MNNAGNPKTSADKNKTKRQPRRAALTMAAGTLVLAVSLIVSVQVFSVLYGLILPPMPPVPDAARELQHENLSYGQDEWRYGVDQNACEVVRFYIQQQPDACELPPICSGDAEDEANLPLRSSIATCGATMGFSAFTLNWQAVIYPAAPAGTSSVYVTRQINWNSSNQDQD